ncbi:putative mitochondrial hypothetical protein [Leptomonas pyrrhocoris]|uniref:ER membrane protein complex subunit 1 n=1 Tax=Leptomonas pyrrhocoris TaxID=157538 RepID=A0A0N0DX43_LEPPY|nr:putative mitochondrial hypothetical protein [Leptomonas pyrrhocoris]XP_015660987.1 putative mitochondrial hypothetical protein [Leptomonas pyrrhocoris]KPA82547.1 putative mitochondrial hypothetical protein [Leptomonas pyrrhocoris]KPA82548.1 putative mitochondrial hypothetical protein [Leptomonas pyrrhocoris]|eukprot:XP_015660986.1 putative mitochondrial hypothetical protein [Leptomonas pyrrhocoris]
MTKFSGTARRFVALFLVGALLLGSITTLAIHEDEQGTRDWVMHLVGNVQDAAVQVAVNPQLIYVASEDGAVAAIDVGAAGALNLTWRLTSTSKPLCVAAAYQAVLTVNDAGVVAVLDPATGSIEVTYALQTVEAPLRAAACAIEGSNAVVVAHDGEMLKRFDFSLASEEETIHVAASTALAGDVSKMYIAGTTLVLNSAANSAEVRSAETLQSVRTVAGIATSIASDGHFTTRDAAALRSFPPAGDAAEFPCADCGIAVVTNTESGTSRGVVRVETGKDTMRIAYPSSELLIPNIGSSSTAYPIAAFETEDGDVVVLIKTGAHNLLLVSARKGLVWRRFEGLANVAATAIVEPMEELDHFHFNKDVLLASRFGTLYSVPLLSMGSEVRLITDFSKELVEALKAPSIAQVQVRGLKVRDNGHTAVVFAVYGTTNADVVVDLVSRQIKEVSTTENSILSTPLLEVGADLSVKGSLPRSTIYTYVSHSATGVIEGYSVDKTAGARATWVVQMPSSIVAHASGSEPPRRTDIVNNMRVFPNISGKEPVEEVRHTYPMRNVIAVAHYEPVEDELPTLVITAIDVVTGGVLATTRHANVEGDVKMVIVEHSIIYYFLDAKKMRYCFGVWELFEDENSPVVTKSAVATLPQIIASFFVNTKREFSSRATRPPVVTVSTLGVFGGPLADMGVTTSYNAIARKSLVLAFKTGRVVVVEVLRLLAGGQMPMPDVKDRQISHVILPSLLFASHKHRLALPQKITTEPTGLESSCHVVVSGLDLFYVRSSSGKPFDLLNSDFNKPLLVTLVCGFAALSFVVRYFVNRKAINSSWQ